MHKPYTTRCCRNVDTHKCKKDTKNNTNEPTIYPKGMYTARNKYERYRNNDASETNSVPTGNNARSSKQHQENIPTTT